VDLKGRTVLPGLMDSHTHPLSAAMTEFDHPIPDMVSIEDVLGYFRSRAAAAKPGEWVVLQQVFITRLRDRRYPTRAELDRAAPDHPAVFRTGPDASFNGLALKESGHRSHYAGTGRDRGKKSKETPVASRPGFCAISPTT